MERLHINDPEWFKNANCATTDPEVMFPKKGINNDMARKICSMCVVVEDCLTSSVIEKDWDRGFRANMTAKERKAYAEELYNGTEEAGQAT